MSNSPYAGKMIVGKSVQNWNASGTFLMAKIPWSVLTYFLLERMPQCTFFFTVVTGTVKTRTISSFPHRYLSKTESPMSVQIILFVLG